MSTALIRQALEFVEQEESGGKRKKRDTKRGSVGQVNKTVLKHKKKDKQPKSADQKVEENIKKLLALSQPAADTETAEKIIKRAIKGKPLLEKIKVTKASEKSILFADEEKETFKKFESELFCS